MNVEVKQDGEIQVVKPKGDVDLKTSPILREKLQGALTLKPKGVLIDMSECSYIDSSGIATLVEALQKLRGTGGRLAIACAVQRVRDIFEIAHLDSVFAMHDSIDAARASLD